MDTTICPSPRCGGSVIQMSDYLKHLRAHHLGENLNIPCPKCDAKDLKFKGFETHWYRNHQIIAHPMFRKLPQCPVSMEHQTPDPPLVPDDTTSQCSGVEGGTQDYAAAGDPTDQPHQDDATVGVPTDQPDQDDATAGDATDQDDAAAGDSSNQPDQDFEFTGETCRHSISDAVCEGEGTAKRSRDHFRTSEQTGTTEVLSYHEEDVGSESGSECAEESVADVDREQREVSDSEVLPEDTRKAADFLLAMRAECGVNKTQVKTVISETKTLLEHGVDATLKKLSEAGCSLEHIDTDTLKQDICSMLDTLKSPRKQDKLLYKQYNIIKPKYVQLDSVLVKKFSGKKRKTCIVPRNFYYIPILKVLEQLLRHPDYETMSERTVSDNPSILDCYMKGRFAAENPVLREHPDALRPYLYYDDLEVCGALGSYASGKQKLGAFYLGLDNIHPKYRASLKTIALVALCDAALLKESGGVDLLLERIKKDLSSLEEGVILNGKLTFGTLIAFTGDNLGVHLIGGMKCGFTAYRFCRWCLAILADTHSLVREVPNLLRTVPEFERQLREIEDATRQTESDRLSREYGINKRCRLNSLQSFHVVTCLPPDLMHDVLEGSLLRTVRNLIKYCVEARIMTLEWLNAAIRDFDYGYTEFGDRPSAKIKSDHLKEDAQLKQSAAQMWILATILPLIIGPLVEENDEHWKTFLTLLEISRIIFSNAVDKDLLPYLSDLIESFLSNSVKLYGHLLPKEHFMSHYPTLLLNFGSLSDFMCMRMEANHQWFKRQTYTLGNYINIAKSLAIRYQERQALNWSKPLIEKTSYGSLSRKKIAEVPYQNLISSTNEVVETSWVSTEGFLLQKEKCYICVGVTPENRPMFVLVMHVIVWPDVLLVCKNVNTEYFDPHLSAYRITVNEQLQVHKIADIKGKRVYHAHYVKDSKFIVLKECVEGSF